MFATNPKMIAIVRLPVYYPYIILFLEIVGRFVQTETVASNSSSEYYYDDGDGDNSTLFGNSTILGDSYSYLLDKVSIGVANNTKNAESRRKEIYEIITTASAPASGNSSENEVDPVADQLPVESVLPQMFQMPPHGHIYTDINYGGTGVAPYVAHPPALSLPVLPNMGVVPIGGSYLEPMNPYIPDMSPAMALPPPTAMAPSPAPVAPAPIEPPMKTEVMVVNGNGEVQVADVVTINHLKHSPDETSTTEEVALQQDYSYNYDDNFQSYQYDYYEKPKFEFPVEPYHDKWPGTVKNPVVNAKDFMYNLVDTVSSISKTDVLLWVEKLLTVIAELKIPREHYVRVVSFAGIYLFLAMMYYGRTTVFDVVCEIETRRVPALHHSYHAGRRFVPARTIDPGMQMEFLNLFRGVDEDEKDSSDEVDSYAYTVINYVEEMCPRDAFFYSMSPRHVRATTALRELFVAQDNPAQVLALARRLLHSRQIHPKVWYLSLVGAQYIRPDMTGFSVAHPIDAIPDWYIPAHLITDLMRKYRKIRIKRGLNETISLKNSKKTKHIRHAKPKKSLKYFHLGSVKVETANSEESDVTMKNISTIATTSTTTTTTTSTTTTAPIVPKIKLNNANVTNLTITGSKAKGEREEFSLEDDIFSNETYSKIHHDFVYNDHFHKSRRKKKGQKKKKRRKKKKGKKKRKKNDDEDCIMVDWRVGIDNGLENRLWYFREDMMVNQHHWYWHQIHPPNATMHADRRAELFFYMHRAFIARYNAERLSNGLPRVIPMDFKPGGVVYDGYNSHMADVNSGIFWTPRHSQTSLADILHEDDPDFARRVLFADYLTAYRRLVKAVKKGSLLGANRRIVPIDNFLGIEPLANTVEASNISVNPWLYNPTGIHNLGHIIVALSADPDYRFHKVSGVMAEAALSMRDPAFYPFHMFMDNFFELYKERLPPYRLNSGDFPLLWKGVDIVKMEVISQGGGEPNELRTFWTHHRFRLSPGVDRGIDKGNDHDKVCAKHLDHEPFHFEITIDRKPCAKSKSGKATVRIFMAPRLDEQGKRMPLKQQRRFMFPLDVFPVKLKIGRNLITRYAEDSSLTQPWTKSLKDLERGPDFSGGADFCGCGWPQHLFIPKGHVVGMAFDLFVMVTNHDEDYVPNNPKTVEIPETCNSPYIFCGIPRRRYPDARPMGYPFDRPLFKRMNCPSGYTLVGKLICRLLNYHREVYSLEEYAAQAPNMAALKFTIKHLDREFPEPARH